MRREIGLHLDNWKMPPKAKFYEALGAVVDGRVKLVGECKAEVQSSDRSKTYVLEWSKDRKQITSNDNASYWQGYVGYPIISVLLKLGILEYDAQLAVPLAGVPWKTLNDKHRRNYEKAVAEALAGNDPEQVLALANHVQELAAALAALGLQRLRSSAKPPTSSEGR